MENTFFPSLIISQLPLSEKNLFNFILQVRTVQFSLQGHILSTSKKGMHMTLISAAEQVIPYLAPESESSVSSLALFSLFLFLPMSQPDAVKIENAKCKAQNHLKYVERP